MSKQQEFIDWVESLIRSQENPVEPPESAWSYFEALKNSSVAIKKPDFTDNGKIILQYLQSQPNGMFKSKDIAEGIMISSRSVSGAMRKLVTDGYVEKIGKNPIVYSITEKGKNVNFEGENE